MLMRVLCFFLLFPTAVLAEAFSGPPRWVKMVELPTFSAAPSESFIENGVLQILTDSQTRLNDTGYEVFERLVQKVVARPGLESAGTVRINFDPADEELAVHQIWRIRDGVRSSVRGVEFLTIRRESEIDYGILDGRLTRYGDIGDVRVGDIIDISWTRNVTPAVFHGHYLSYVSAQPYSGFLIDQTRLLASSDIEISVNGPALGEMRVLGSENEFIWRHENVERPEFDYETQSWDTVFGLTQVATKADWSDVVDVVREAYQPVPLPDDLAARVATFDGNQEERVTAAFRLVQDEVRYMGIEIGAGGYIPRAPSLVWSRRFGDCKDKALLLVSMLDYMNIPADAVLVTSRDGADLIDHPPSPYAFNHAIVRVVGPDGTYFLDPTDVLQGGIGASVTTSDFAWALPISDGSAALVAVPHNTMQLPEYEVITRYDFGTPPEGFVASLTETTIYRGENADYQRQRFASNGTERRAKTYLEWYQRKYPGTVALGHLTLEDDFDSNTLKIHEHYGITEEGMAEKWEKFWLNPYGVKGELPELPDEPLEKPYTLDQMYLRHRVEVVGLNGLRPFPEHAFDNTFFRFQRTSSTIERGISGVFVLQTKTDEILPAQAEAYEKAREEAHGKRDRRYNLTGARRASVMVMGYDIWTMIVAGTLGVLLIVSLTAGAVGFRAGRKGDG